MAQKTHCDICDKVFEPVILDFRKDHRSIEAKVIIDKKTNDEYDDERSGMDVCKYCLADAFYKIDDRPRQKEGGK